MWIFLFNPYVLSFLGGAGFSFWATMPSGDAETQGERLGAKGIYVLGAVLAVAIWAYFKRGRS